MANEIDEIINATLLKDEEYARKIMQHMRAEYFQDIAKKTVFQSIQKYFEDYNTTPSITELTTILTSLKGKVADNVLARSIEMVEDSPSVEVKNFQWLMDTTEKFCKDRAIYNAIMQSVGILEGNVKGKTRDSMPDILREALAVSFDNKIGHDYFEDMEARWAFYHQDIQRIPFHLSLFNRITGGGLPRKTLTIAVAGTNVGKSAFMCDLAANYLREGYNVLYITMEMAEERISERVDANVLETPISEIKDLNPKFFFSKIAQVKKTTSGRLFVKEFPTKSAGVVQFNALLRELRIKKEFTPDVVFVDYLNICAAMKAPADSSLYVYAKAVAEELRGFAMEHDIAVFTATQTNRQGQNNSDPTLEEVGESHGISQTADLIFALIRTEDLREQGRVLVKQLKNRFGSVDYYNKFVICVDLERMIFYDSPDGEDFEKKSSKKKEDEPVFDNSSAGLAFGNSDFIL